MTIEVPKEKIGRLAFLLGFFDGDGKQGTTRITTNSQLFLFDIKTLFGIKKVINTFEYKTKSGEKKVSYRLHLGADFFNEMLDNYNNSLSRKRMRFKGSEGPRKFKFTKKELKTLVWEMPKTMIALLHARKFGIKISPITITYWCKKWAINTPRQIF